MHRVKSVEVAGVRRWENTRIYSAVVGLLFGVLFFFFLVRLVSSMFTASGKRGA